MLKPTTPEASGTLDPEGGGQEGSWDGGQHRGTRRGTQLMGHDIGITPIQTPAYTLSP